MLMGNVCPDTSCFPGLRLWLSRTDQGPVALVEPSDLRENHMCVSANRDYGDMYIKLQDLTGRHADMHWIPKPAAFTEELYGELQCWAQPCLWLVEPGWIVCRFTLTQVQQNMRKNKNRGQMQETGRRKHIRINPFVPLFLSFFLFFPFLSFPFPSFSFFYFLVFFFFLSLKYSAQYSIDIININSMLGTFIGTIETASNQNRELTD